MILDLIINFVTFIFNAIVAIFTNVWVFAIVFMIMGIVAIKENAKGAAFVCIMLAFIVFVNIVL